MRKWMAAAAFATAALAMGCAAMAGSSDDPYAWLTDIHGEKPMAWVAQQDARTLSVLKTDPRYQKDYDAVLKVLDAKDRIPMGNLDHHYVFNFWQDANHVRGVWRRTTITDYANADPHWETVLDIDALDAAEHKDWVWKGADCTPALDRCLVNLSPGGGDAVEIREFNPETKTFYKDGFTLAEAKSNASYVDENTILFATDFGKGSLTTSGYARIVKLWHRGEPISAAKTVYEGKTTDVASQPVVMRGPYGAVPMIFRGISFFTAEYYVVKPDGSTVKLPLPLTADVKGVSQGQLLATLRADWTPPGGETIKQGALFAFPVLDFVKTGEVPKYTVLFTPGPRQSIDGVAPGRDAVYASIYDNVVGSVHVFRAAANGTWHDSKLDLPQGGSASVISTNDWGPEADLSFESFLQPTTLYADSGNDRPVAIKSLPARFDASGLETQQFEATSKDGTKVPYFVVRQKGTAGPRPTVLYGYGGFEVSLTPSYSANFGMLWLTQGGVYVLANIRGGGEFGPAWHEAALKYHRQRAYDDFEAVAADLETRGITTPKQLGIMGGSNGGLLVSTVMTQRPDLLGAVVCQVPLIDMLTYTHFGAGASWIGEYGDPADPKMAAYIRTYSPYQNVHADRKYAPVFFWTTTSDDRVTPIHARKMAAKMEAQGHDALFYESTEGGHSAGATHRQQAEMWALSFVYLAKELGLK